MNAILDLVSVHKELFRASSGGLQARAIVCRQSLKM